MTLVFCYFFLRFDCVIETSSTSSEKWLLTAAFADAYHLSEGLFFSGRFPLRRELERLAVSVSSLKHRGLRALSHLYYYCLHQTAHQFLQKACFLCNVALAPCLPRRGLLSTTHQNVSLKLELAPGVQFDRAFTTFPVEPTQDGVKVELGDLFAEERRDVLISLRLPAAQNEALQALGRLTASGFSVVQTRSEQELKPLMLERRAQARWARWARWR